MNRGGEMKYLKLDTSTKVFLIILAAAAGAWEIAAVLWEQPQMITPAMAQLSCGRPWIPFTLGALIVHFLYPLREYPDNAKERIICWTIIWLGLIVTWEALMVWGPGWIANSGTALCSQMGPVAIVGGIGAHFLWPRERVPDER